MGISMGQVEIQGKLSWDLDLGNSVVSFRWFFVTRCTKPTTVSLKKTDTFLATYSSRISLIYLLRGAHRPISRSDLSDLSACEVARRVSVKPHCARWSSSLKVGSWRITIDRNRWVLELWHVINGIWMGTEWDMNVSKSFIIIHNIDTMWGPQDS